MKGSGCVVVVVHVDVVIVLRRADDEHIKTRSSRPAAPKLSSHRSLLPQQYPRPSSSKSVITKRYITLVALVALPSSR